MTEKDSRTMSPSRFTAKKNNKNIGGRKIHEYGKPKAPTNFFSITPLFNLLALHNKLNPKSVLMECMVFFLLNCLYNIYLFTFVFKICLFILAPVMCNLFPKRGMLFLKLNRGKLHENKQKISVM